MTDEISAPIPLPRWSSDLPRLAGQIKSVPEDFLVEEIPAYEPSGSGEHLYLWVEKRALAGEQMLRELARALEISPGEIGSAGIKDRQAVTRQWLSVPAKCEPQVAGVETDQFRILRFARHGNKLRTGHLRGNRFTIVVRDAQPADGSDVAEPFSIAERAVEVIGRRGFPNYYGDQRFGHDGETLSLGLDLLAGRKSPRDIPYSRRKFLLRMSLSAAQSELFNQTLAARLTDGLLDTVLAGDVMEVTASGGKFVVEDPGAEQKRCDGYETVVTGPMFGPKMKQPTGIPAERESRVLSANELTMENFRGFGDLLSGTRRPFVVRPDGISVQAVPEGLRFEFTLPAGVYATTLLAELLG
ncbi:MAG: tRNA pseudouridine(13) synthase TruD [Planctomycetaceae bacterium]